MRGAHNSGQWLPRIAVTFAVTTAVVGCVTDDKPTWSTERARILVRVQNLPTTEAVQILPARSADAAIARRRGELLLELEHDSEAEAELAVALALAPDLELVALHRSASLRAAARRGDIERVRSLLATAPIELRPRLATQATAFIDKTLLERLAHSGPDLAAAVASQIEDQQGPAAALWAREQVVRLTPDDADAWDALARARIAAGKVDDALAAWDRAIVLAPAQSAFRTAPIQALVLAEQVALAKQRAEALATDARTSRNVERLVAASAGAAFVDAKLALSLAREALALRPSDGRIAFLVAQRLAEADDKSGAARAYADLLVCGAHGKPWHRHEVAAKLQQLGGALASAALAITRTCEVPEPSDLAPYVETLRGIR